MADQACGERVSSKLKSWLKGLLTTLLGLSSGAVLMYASPLIDRVVKPAKPLANFAAQPQGWQVVFQNRSTGGTEGWWDFGDGSALEPFVPAQPTVTHTYPRQGTYSCKLSVRNLIGEEHDRTVTINLDDNVTATPSIDSLTVVPVLSTYAPATFRVVSKVKNADLCVWCLGNEKPLEVVTDVGGGQERLVTFKRPGTHVVRLAAFNGKHAVEKSEVVLVLDPPKGSATVTLHVKRDAMQVQSKSTTRTIAVHFPAQSRDTVVPLSAAIPADNGFQIADARVLHAVNVDNLNAEISADHLQLKLTGQQTRPTGLLLIPRNVVPQAVIQVAMTEVRQMPTQGLAVDPVASTIAVPGSTVLPVPKLDAGWVMKQQNLGMDLRDGERVVWQTSQVPASGVVVFQGRQCRVNATLAGDQVRVDLTLVDPRSGLMPLGN